MYVQQIVYKSFPSLLYDSKGFHHTKCKIFLISEFNDENLIYENLIFFHEIQLMQ